MTSKLGAKMKKRFLLIAYAVLFPSVVFSMSIVVPSLPIPDEINNVTLRVNELPFEVIREVIDTGREPSAGGWQIKSCNRYEDMIQGLAVNYKTIGFIAFSKYGVFSSPQDAMEAAELAIPNNDPFLITKWRSGSFSGNQIGISCFHWEPSYESARKLAGISPLYQQAILSFARGRYSFLLGMASEHDTVDTLMLESIAKKVEKKIEVSVTLDELPARLASLVSNPGLLRSLQVKIDHFVVNYRQGNYQAALGNINSFINEIEAQRGKHVTEPGFQTLIGYADAIVQSLKVLMQK